MQGSCSRSLVDDFAWQNLLMRYYTGECCIIIYGSRKSVLMQQKIQAWMRYAALIFSILSHYVGYYGACNRQGRVLKRSMVDPMFKTLFLCVSLCVLETCGCCNAVWRSKAASQTSSINKKTTALQGLHRLNGTNNCHTVSSLLCHLETLNTANPPLIFQYFRSYLPF